MIDGGLLWALGSVVVWTGGDLLGKFATALVLIVLASAACLFRDAINGQSPGKLVCGVRVIDERTGRAATMERCAARNGPLALWLLGITFGCALIGPETAGESGKLLAMVLFLIGVRLPKGHRLGDGIAHTRVISVKHADKLPFRVSPTLGPSASEGDDGRDGRSVLIIVAVVLVVGSVLLFTLQRPPSPTPSGAAEFRMRLGGVVRDTPSNSRQSDRGVPDTESVATYQLAAENGDAEAQFNLGRMYDEGHGVPRNPYEAVKWYRLAADQGHALGEANLGVMYMSGEGVPKDLAEAVRWFRLAAEQGDSTGQCNLGSMYGSGSGVPRDDTEAAKWYRLAAMQGNALGQSNLGGMYLTGQGVPKDATEAVKWFRLAADQGSALGQSNLGLMYSIGQGVTKDHVEAVKWFRLAAEQGTAEAQFNLARKYVLGEGVPKDYVQAHSWLRLAAEGGVEEAPKMLKVLAREMSASQLVEAQRIAREFRPGASRPSR